MDFGKAFSFVFEDPDWIRKIVIMGLIMLIPVIGPLIVAGWSNEITRKIIRHENNTLPELDFGNQLAHGFHMLVVALVYSLPAILLIVAQVLINHATGGFNTAWQYQSWTDVALNILNICFTLVYIAYLIALCFLLPIAYGRYADYGTLGSALQIGPVFERSTKVVVPLLIVLLGIIAATFIANLGWAALCVGVLFTTTYAYAVVGHFNGQVYHEAMLK